MYYRDFGSFPKNKEKLRRMLRPYKNEVNEMSQSIVSSSGYVITRREVRSLRTSELHSEIIRGSEESLMTSYLRSLVILWLNPLMLILVSMFPILMTLIRIPLSYLKIMTLPDGNAAFEKPITDQ